MKQRISYDSSDYSGSVVFWIVIILLICCCFFWWTPDYNTTYDAYNQATYSTSGWGWAWTWGWILLGILFLWWLLALCFAPLDVYADDDEVRVRRPFKTRRFKMSDIQSVEPYQVPKTAKGKAFKSMPVRTFGKWGQYHDDKIGDYYAYYGKPDNTVLITLKDGRKYVVGASDAKELADYINTKISNS